MRSLETNRNNIYNEYEFVKSYAKKQGLSNEMIGYFWKMSLQPDNRDGIEKEIETMSKENLLQNFSSCLKV